MSEQADAMLQLPNSHNFQREKVKNYRSNAINTQNFFQWTRNDMYRSSYAHHHSPDSSQPRSHHIPGYQGFIPKDRAESLHAKTFSNKTKQVFNSTNVNLNRSGLATTGFNITKDALVDKSKNASSSKYGKSELQKSHPGWVPAEWVSTTKAVYISPEKYGDPTRRATDKRVETTKINTKTSGFQQARAYGDGKGWKNNPVLSPESLTSEYRDRFNPETEYHRKVDKNVLGQLKPAEYKYKFNK